MTSSKDEGSVRERNRNSRMTVFRKVFWRIPPESRGYQTQCSQRHIGYTWKLLTCISHNVIASKSYTVLNSELSPYSRIPLSSKNHPWFRSEPYPLLQNIFWDRFQQRSIVSTQHYFLARKQNCQLYGSEKCDHFRLILGLNHSPSLIIPQRKHIRSCGQRG